MISIRPWDIALATEPVHGVSIQNQIRSTVTRCTTHERSMLLDVQIGSPLVVEISRRGAAALNVKVDQPIVCLIKSQAIEYVGTL